MAWQSLKLSKAATCVIGAVAMTAAVAISTATVGAHNGDPGCKTVTGKAVATLIPSPNDPLGRTLGSTTGNLKAAVNTYLTSLAPQPDGSLKATTVETWALGAQDILQFAGEANFTPIPGAPLGTVENDAFLTVIGGTGQFAGATGSLQLTGTGYNLFGPGAGPGATFFDLEYRGSICLTK
jgi:hypothetical protein